MHSRRWWSGRAKISARHGWLSSQDFIAPDLSRAEIFAPSAVTSFNSNICEIVIDGYGADLISVASDRVDFHPWRRVVPFRRGINKEVRRYMRSVAAVYGFGLTIKPSLVLPDPL